MAKGAAPVYAGVYKGFAVFIDHDGATLFAVPKEKFGPDSNLQDEEIILASSYRHICLQVDGLRPDVPGCVACSWYGEKVYKYCSACQKLIESQTST